MDNKVQFNLKNVHYAVLTLEDGVPSWATPVAVPGAVTLTLNPTGSINPFYADGIVYYKTPSNNGYSGDLEMARFHDQMLQEIWGFVLDATDKVLVESDGKEPSSFALLYQIDGDANDDLYCLYNVTGTKPGIGGTTNTETKTPQTRSSTVTATALSDGRVMARTTASTTAEVKANWFKKVYEKVPEAAVAPVNG